MQRVEPGLVQVVTDLERGLRELGIPFGIVGALVPELLLEARPAQMTNDADVTVFVQSFAEFETLKDRLAAFGFTRTRVPHLQLEEGVIFNMAGFGQVVPHALPTQIEGGPTVPLAPLPLYALLKLVAFSDRKLPKDLTGVLHCLQHYLENDDRRYGVEHQGEGVPWEYTCAYLLGADGRRFLNTPLRDAVTGVLERFSDPDAEVIGVIARENGRMLIDADERVQIFEHFRWYRLGGDV